MSRRRLLPLVALAAFGAGCGGPLQLRQDHRLRIVAPAEDAVVAPPVVVRWHVDRKAFRPRPFDGSHDAHRGVFAVFVDRAPMAPGRNIDSLAEHDAVCSVSPGCPDAAWLAEHGVFLTTRPALAFTALPVGSGRRAGAGRRRHEVTVVLLDGRGARIGESAWTRVFYEREDVR
jgi:hypothetical protein